MRGVDDEHVGAGVEQVLGLGRDVAVDADGRRDPQPAGVVDGGGVQVRPQRARPGEDADQPAVVGHDRGEPAAGVRQGVEGRLDVDAVLQRHHVADHDVVDLGEPVDPGEVGLGDDADRAVADGDDGGAVGPLVQQHERLADGHRGGQGDRGVVDEVARLLPGDDVAHDLGRDVLRDDGERTPAGGRLGHPAAGDGGHVGDDEGDRRARAVDGREVDVEPAGHRRPVRHHEDVVVGEVELRLEVVEETHPPSVGAAGAGGAGPASGSGSTRLMGQDRDVSLHGPFARGCRPTRRSAPDAAARRVAARARRGRLRADPQPRPVRGLGLRQHRGRGRDGRRAGRLVRGDRAVPAPARAAGAAHGDHPQAQERDRPQPAGVRDRELPHRGDRPRPAGGGARGGAGRAVARGGRAPAPGAHRGGAGGARRAGADVRRRGAGAGRGLPRAAAGAGAGGADRRHPARGDRRRADPPRAGRPRPGAAARLARRQPRHVCRGAGRAGAVVVAAVGRRQGDRLDLPAGARLAAGHPRRPAATRRARRSTTCSAGSPPTCRPTRR